MPRGRKPKLSDDETRALCLDYVFFDESQNSLREKYKITEVGAALRRGLKKGFITNEEMQNSIRRNRHELTHDELNSLCFDYILFDDSIDKIAKNYEVNVASIYNHLRIGIRDKVISDESRKSSHDRRQTKNVKEITRLKRGFHSFTSAQRAEIGRRSGNKTKYLRHGIFKLTTAEKREIGKATLRLKKGIHGRSSEQMSIDGVKGGKRSMELGLGIHRMTYEQKQVSGSKGGKISGVKVSEQHRKNAYNLENRFHASSQQEGAVALLLEKYVSGYQINDGTNFQVRNNGINNGGIDFLVNDEFLEWHPIIPSVKVRQGRGDIPKEEMPSYLKVRASLTEEERKQFEQDYKEVLSANYYNRRKASIRNSGYQGLELHLARTLDELYQFIAGHSTTLPSYGTFKTEFNQKVEYVKTFKVEKKPAQETIGVAT